MSNIPKTYEPQQFEKEIYAAWEKDKNFHTTADKPGEPYCIVIPPPNVTGQLHMGHALDETLQDIFPLGKVDFVSWVIFLRRKTE